MEASRESDNAVSIEVTADAVRAAHDQLARARAARGKRKRKPAVPSELTAGLCECCEDRIKRLSGSHVESRQRA